MRTRLARKRHEYVLQVSIQTLNGPLKARELRSFTARFQRITRVFIAETRERVKSMCCYGRPRFPSPHAGAQAYSTPGGVFPVDHESVFACEHVNFLLLLEFGVAVIAEFL